MIELIDVNYNMLNENKLSDLFSLRKKVFKDRLNWSVKCTMKLEFDEYDNDNATYILGIYNESILCSVRFIETKYHNMITGTFKKYFDRIELPEGNFLEASRLFVDKKRREELGLKKYPISLILFLSMINYAMKFNYEAIYAIVSRQMYAIFKRSGWKIAIIASGISEKNETIYLIYMPVDEFSKHALIRKITEHKIANTGMMSNWPLIIPVEEKVAE